MSSSRNFKKRNLTRARKGGAAKAKRQRDQKKRLVALGMDETAVSRMNAREVLTKLKYPAKVAREFQTV